MLIYLIIQSLTFIVFAQPTDTESIITNCNDCHGIDGVSTESDIPIIAGQSSMVLEDALIAFSQSERPCSEINYRKGDRSRPSTTMCEIASSLTENQILTLSEYYGGLKFSGATQDFRVELVNKGSKIHERHCEKCHSENGSLADDDAGLLAGQWTLYLRKSIENFLSGKRPMADKMSVKLKLLKEEDIEALLSFYASR